MALSVLSHKKNGKIWGFSVVMGNFTYTFNRFAANVLLGKRHSSHKEN